MVDFNPFSPPLPKKHGDKIHWGNLKGSSLAVALTKAANQNSGPIIVITKDNATANKIERELKVFAIEDKHPVYHFPDWETLPYDTFSPHQDIISDRLLAFNRLPHMQKGLVVVPVYTLMHWVAPKNYCQRFSFVLKVGDKLNLDTIRLQLTTAGYRLVSEVLEHGEFALRGSILDLYPMGSKAPIRIDLFDDEIDTIRFFNPETQLSGDKITHFSLLPAREFPLTDEAITLFRNQWRQLFNAPPTECHIYRDVSNKTPPAGIEYYLPLFFEQLDALTDYFPPNSQIALLDNIEQAGNEFWQNVLNRYEQYGHDIKRPLMQPKQLFFPINELFAKLKNFSQIQISEHPIESSLGKYNYHHTSLPDLTIESRLENPLAKLKQFIKNNKNRILLCAESKGRRESLRELLTHHELKPTLYDSWLEFFNSNTPFGLTIAPLDSGGELPQSKITLIAEAELYGQRVMQRRRRRKMVMVEEDSSIRSLAELTIGDPVVHLEHGVGRYLGLMHIELNNQVNEFLTIEYANHDKLYVPVSSLHLISLYSGAGAEAAPLHKLGSELWDKAKQKAALKARDVAAELLDIYARREARSGFAFKNTDGQYFSFANQFPFEETPDQAKAIEDVLQDMHSDKPMDRLVCGDVGFGKTEVALRAAFIAAINSRQVALLVPTTLLAQQHYETFSDRFADWPIKVEVLSRFKTAKEQAVIIEQVKNGQVDILIGTHKIIQPEIKFKSLGLLIIDEEHRFGVQQKEKFKALRSEVDILTLTATPIPRTLNMAMSAIRDLSIIATPPAKRLSIKTFVREHNKAIIQEAIMRELMRGGQVYYLHNCVETIQRVGQELRELIPEARIGIAHGQMRERELEGMMSDFYHQRFNVLVCTTIIETGIDIPSANTIIIDRADKLGLAQLHQLRGRVGRSHHQAYAYCLTPNRKSLKKDAIKRLEALESLEDLGAGFSLATHDLEIRGAGELLGEEQSGNMTTIGFTLYMELLDKAVNALKSGKDPKQLEPLQQGPEIDLQLSALIPEDYLPDVHSRLILYKRISNAKSADKLNELKVEMIDRFGLLPEPVKNLFNITQIKLAAEPIGIKKIVANNKGGKVEFVEHPNINPDKIIELCRTQPQHYRLSGSSQIKLTLDMPTGADRLTVIQNLIALLSSQ